jgi:hypothetical protein
MIEVNKHILPTFISYKPIVTCVGFQDSFKKFITTPNVSTPPFNTQRSKLVKTIIDARFGNTCKSMGSITMVKTLHPQT